MAKRNLDIIIGAHDRATGVLRGIERRTGAFMHTIRRLTLAGGGLGAILGGVSVGMGAKLAEDLEQAEVAFTTIIGNAKDAKQLLTDLSEFASSTPFRFPELQDSARKLLAFGVAAGDIVPTLRSVGDVSAGINAPISDIAEIFGKARVQGRLFMEDINQLTGRGIPIIGELAQQFGVAESEVRNLVSSGRVNFGNLEQAFKSLTSEGGRFSDMMQNQSRTLGGLRSTLTDNFSLIARDVSQALLEAFDVKGAAEVVIDKLGNVREAVGTLTPRVVELTRANLGAIKSAGMIALKLGLVAAGIPVVVTGIRSIASALMLVTAHPIVAVSAAVAGLAIALDQAINSGRALDLIFDGFNSALARTAQQLGIVFEDLTAVDVALGQVEQAQERYNRAMAQSDPRRQADALELLTSRLADLRAELEADAGKAPKDFTDRFSDILTQANIDPAQVTIRSAPGMEQVIGGITARINELSAKAGELRTQLGSAGGGAGGGIAAPLQRATDTSKELAKAIADVSKRAFAFTASPMEAALARVNEEADKLDRDIKLALLFNVIGDEEATAKIAAIKQAAEAKRVEIRQQATSTLEQERLNFLQAEAELGNQAAQRELERLRVADQFNERKRVLLAILEDEGATLDQQREAREALARLAEQEQRAASAPRQPFGFTQPTPGPTLEQSRFLTGVREQTQQNQIADLRREVTAQQKQGNTIAQQTLDAMRMMAEAMRSGDMAFIGTLR